MLVIDAITEVSTYIYIYTVSSELLEHTRLFCEFPYFLKSPWEKGKCYQLENIYLRNTNL